MRKRRIPRPVKTLLWLLAGLAALLAFYIAIGRPSLTVQMAFRRAEHARLVGPGQILAEVELEGDIRLIVGKTKYNYELFACDPAQVDFCELRCYAVTGDMALFTVPMGRPRYGTSYGTSYSQPLELILFDREARAVRAELSFVQGERSYTAQAGRAEEGFFLFALWPDSAEAASELDLLADAAGSYHGADPLPVQVRLYDGQDNLLREETLLAGKNIRFE